MTDDIDIIIENYTTCVNSSHKMTFHESAKERFNQLFFLPKNFSPDFALMRNKSCVFFYKLIIYKYETIVKKYKDKVWSTLYKFNKENIPEPLLIEKVYTELLEYYNNIIVKALNKIQPIKYTFETFSYKL